MSDLPDPAHILSLQRAEQQRLDEQHGQEEETERQRRELIEAFHAVRYCTVQSLPPGADFYDEFARRMTFLVKLLSQRGELERLLKRVSDVRGVEWGIERDARLFVAGLLGMAKVGHEQEVSLQLREANGLSFIGRVNEWLRHHVALTFFGANTLTNAPETNARGGPVNLDSLDLGPLLERAEAIQHWLEDYQRLAAAGDFHRGPLSPDALVSWERCRQAAVDAEAELSRLGLEANPPGPLVTHTAGRGRAVSSLRLWLLFMRGAASEPSLGEGWGERCPTSGLWGAVKVGMNRLPDLSRQLSELREIVCGLQNAVDEASTLGGKADNKADKKPKKAHLIPENGDVLKLAKKIKRDREKGMSLIDSAREFCEDDEAKAQSLLRQLRRFPHLLE